MSLKTQLNQIIKDRNGGIVSITEIEDFCHKAHYKLSNAERRLRPSDSPNIAPVWNEKRTAIIGYTYKHSGDIAPIINKASELNRRRISPECCPSLKIFGVHSRECETNKVTALF